MTNTISYGITEDLPRFDICSNEIPKRIPNDRGLLHSPNYPQDVAQYLSCNKQLYVPRQSRLRLFMLEKSIEYSHVLNINLLNNIRTLAVNELLDINITQRNDEIAQFELKTNHLDGGKFLLYFQIDSSLSEYAPFDLDPDRRLDSNTKHGKTSLKRQWGIVIGCIIGLLLLLFLLATIFIIFRITKRRRERSLKYLKSDDDHRERLSVPKPSSSNTHHHHQVEQPYLASSSPAILPLTSSSNHNRPHSASSTTSSIIVHQINDGQSDRESLIKPTGYGITEDLPRFDICSNEIPKRIPNDRGLLHSPNYPQDVGQYLSCNKQLYVPRQSRLRLFMLEKSIEYSHVLNINFLNNIRTLAVNELLDINITQRNDEIAQFELKTNHLGGGKFLLYFQIDSRLSEYAPFDLDPDRRLDGNIKHGKTSLKRQWGIVIGCIIGLLLLLLLLATIFIIFRITKRRRERSLKYLKSDDDHRERLSVPKPSSSNTHHHHHQVEQPYLASSSPAILPLTSSSNHNRPHSASSTTSSIIVHQINDGQSDRESLIKPTGQIQSHSNADIDNFYEEIKEQQQQTALALGLNTSKGDILNPYLEAKCFEQKKPLFQGNTHPSTQPIRDHHENDSHYQHPISSTDRILSNEPIKPKKRPPPKIPTQRMDIQHPEPSAPPLHIIEDNNNEN
ncbi:unnamed protein product [Adineta steineri]|uniref:CUB domain-containing protein n=1 Tax=Adineta steineri TaxID=433720 RepID=A0A814BWA4_9BILA|nr:unnamed protein product [Adineta steineri]